LVQKLEVLSVVFCSNTTQTPIWGKSSEAAVSRHASAETLSQSSFSGIVPVFNPLKGRSLIYEDYMGYRNVKEA